MEGRGTILLISLMAVLAAAGVQEKADKGSWANPGLLTEVTEATHILRAALVKVQLLVNLEKLPESCTQGEAAAEVATTEDQRGEVSVVLEAVALEEQEALEEVVKPIPEAAVVELEMMEKLIM